MDFKLKIRLKIRDIFRKYWGYVIIVAFAVGILVSVNKILIDKKNNNNSIINNHEKDMIPTIDNQYEIFNDNLAVSYKKVNNLISKYVEYCNNKEYEKAYDLLDNNFKDSFFKNIDRFKIYIDTVFKTKKIYNIKNYYNSDNIYIYNVQITDDILANGTTEKYESVEDKYVAIENNGQLKLAFNGYCGKNSLNIKHTDDFLEIDILNKVTKYDKEEYEVKIKNKTSNYIVISDSNELNEVTLEASGTTNGKSDVNQKIIILPNESNTKIITFDKYVDDGKSSRRINFNAIRVLKRYSGKPENFTKELQDAVKLYSISLEL